jgi:hypothetical protein
MHYPPSEIYTKLNTDAPLILRRNLLGQYIQSRLADQRKNPALSQAIAYEIAGMLSTQTAKELADSDPCKSTLLLAGELELPKHIRARSSRWLKMRQLMSCV